MQVTPHITQGFSEGCFVGLFFPFFFDGLAFSGRCSGKFTISAKAGSKTTSFCVRYFVSIEVQMGMHFLWSSSFLPDVSSSLLSSSSPSDLTLASDLISSVPAAEANLSRLEEHSCLALSAIFSFVGTSLLLPQSSSIRSTGVCCRGR